jgi:starvation-inducible outer membrane lipoprotein
MKLFKFTLLLFSLGLCGCQSVTKQLQQVPSVEFESFSYHRSGNVTSASIVATNAKKTDDKLEIEAVSIQQNYGPFLSTNIELRGYKRAIPKVMTSDAEAGTAEVSTK